jgi:hypothetical protein
MDDFFIAKNKPSHRILGLNSTAIIHLCHSDMADGDKAGLAIFHYHAAWIGISKSGSTTTLQRVNDALMSSGNGW